MAIYLRFRLLDGYLDPEQVFLSFFAHKPGAFWLDSGRQKDRLGRYSYMGSTRHPAWRHWVGEHAPLLPALGAKLAAWRVDCPKDYPFPFAGGFVGYFGYEFARELVAQTFFPSPYPDAMLLRVDRFIAVDHQHNKAYLVWHEDDDHPYNARQWAERLRRDWDRLSREPQLPIFSQQAAAGKPEQSPAPVFIPALDRETYLRRIERCQDFIEAGDSYEICLTNQFTAACRPDPVAVYRHLRRHNPTSYGAFLAVDDLAICCSSPERFLTLDQVGWIESRPIKGTARRDEDAEKDATLASALATDEKSRAENLMIVDLLRNDLSRVCAVGSVHVPTLMKVETYETAHQLVSTIRGKLRPGFSITDALAACFPGGSMTGAPKLRTMEIISALEGRERGIYSGSLGFISVNGCADLNIVIRTAIIGPNKVTIGSGGAIVADSDPVQEYAEMCLKAEAPMQAVYDAVANADKMGTTRHPNLSNRAPDSINFLRPDRQNIGIT